MPADILTLYIVSIFIVIMIPGPLSLFMVSNSVNFGIVKSYPAFLGGAAASSMYLVLSRSHVRPTAAGIPYPLQDKAQANRTMPGGLCSSKSRRLLPRRRQIVRAIQ